MTGSWVSEDHLGDFFTWFRWLLLLHPLISANPRIPWEDSQEVPTRTTKLPVTEPYAAERPVPHRRGVNAPAQLCPSGGADGGLILRFSVFFRRLPGRASLSAVLPHPLPVLTASDPAASVTCAGKEMGRCAGDRGDGIQLSFPFEPSLAVRFSKTVSAVLSCCSTGLSLSTRSSPAISTSPGSVRKNC